VRLAGVGEHGDDTHSSAPQEGARVQGVTPVVAGADQQHDPPTRMRRRHPLADDDRDRVRRPAHQRLVAVPGQRDRLDGADLFDGVGLDHPPILAHQDRAQVNGPASAGKTRAQIA
jgi:hypothetical protein